MEETKATAEAEVKTQQPQPEIDPVKLRAFQRLLESEQVLSMAIMGGVAAAIVGAGIWAAIAAAAASTLGWMAIGVGCLVAFAVRFLGKGVTNSFGIVGAIFALLGSLMGNVAVACIFVAEVRPISFGQALMAAILHPSFAGELLGSTFRFWYLLYYGIAIGIGFWFSFRHLTPEGMVKLAKNRQSQSM